MTVNFSCLYTTVKNTSGVRHKFGFIPPHGVELDVDEEYTVFGDIRQLLGSNAGGEHSVRRRAQIAFESAIESGKLSLVETPANILQDTVTDESKMLQLASGVITAVDPCYYSSTS